MRGWTMRLSFLLIFCIGGKLIYAKDHHKNNVHKQAQKKESVPRFIIPHPSHPESAFLPEAIGQSVGSQRGQIVGTELPGAYGEDYDMENMESGSGVASGSGSGSEKDSESPESPGKYGTNLVHNPPPSNPSAAFMGNSNEKGDDEDEKEDVDLGKELDADDNSEEKKEEKNSENLESTSQKSETVKKEEEDESEKSKMTKKHHTKQERSNKLAKKKTKGKEKDHEETNMISKIDAIAKQIEKVEHREKLDRKEAATLKVAKKVAKKVIKNINAKKKQKKSHKKVTQKFFDEFAEEEDTKSHKKETSSAKEEPKGPEGFECPWACFWTCHSYCPKECCNNPFKCDLACREFCTPYCSDRCCAPGSQRLPKLQINFNAEDAERKNISAIFSEDDKHQLPSNISSPSTREKDEEDAKLHTRLDPAENSYQQLKEQEHQIALTNQIEALKKATSYAAQLMGLPPECPLACARICLPGLCKQQCCARSQVPNVPIVPHTSLPGPINQLGSANFNNPGSMIPGPQFNPSSNKLALAKQYALARKQQYMMTHNGMFGVNPASAAFHSYPSSVAANKYMMNKLALQNRLLEGKNDFVPALARYRALQYANQLNRQKMMLKNSLEPQASRQQDASQRCQPGYPCQSAASSSSVPSWLHNCPPICRSSCIPQCPNECCAHSTSGSNTGAASLE